MSAVQFDQLIVDVAAVASRLNHRVHLVHKF